MNTLFADVGGDATFSPCGKYRYTLTRQWEDVGFQRWATWIMLNPSTADAKSDDPTIRRCISFSKSWGCGGLIVLNLFAFRATDPKALSSADDPVGPENDATLRRYCGTSGITVAAWGVHGVLNGRAAAVLSVLSRTPLRCLGVTKENHPKHPLYVAGSAEPTIYRWEFPRTQRNEVAEHGH
jgi:hypothetical protein